MHYSRARLGRGLQSRVLESGLYPELWEGLTWVRGYQLLPSPQGAGISLGYGRGAESDPAWLPGLPPEDGH